ncbi:thiol reductant ABC exporter subunit CydC [Propionibacteriaceae bacterium G1746]
MNQLRRLFSQVLADVPHGRWRLVASVLLAACASGASVALMGVSGWLLSRAAEMPPVLYLQAAAVGVRFFGISRGFFRYVERLVGHDLALRLQQALRLRTYDSLSRTTLLGRRRGDLLNRVIGDVAAINDLVVRVVVPFCAASLVIIGTTLLLGRFSIGSALVLFTTSVLAGIVVPLLTSRITRGHDAAVAPVRGRLADEVHELARAASDLVAAGAGTAALDKALARDAELRRIEARTSWVRGLAQGAQLLATGIAVASALWIGGAAVESGDLKPRLLAVLVLVPLAMHEVINGLTQAAQTFTRTRSALTRLDAVLAAEPVGQGDVTGEHSTDPALVVDHADIGWPGHAPVVRDFSLAVGRGERVALVGPSGSGKTTVAATLMGAIPPQSGTVAVRGRVGYLAQDAHLFATTVAENVRIGHKDATDADVLEALGRARLPLAPDRVLAEAGTAISGGEARRLALARVLVHDSDCWIIDEPTEHLDSETAQALMDDLWQAAGDRPVLVITHDPAVIAACGRIIDLAGHDTGTGQVTAR